MAVGYIERAGYRILSFTASNLATFRRRCFDRFVRGKETAGDKINFKRAERELCSLEKSGRDGPKSQVGRMDRVDIYFLHLEKLDSSGEHRSGKDAAKRNEGEKRERIRIYDYYIL